MEEVGSKGRAMNSHTESQFRAVMTSESGRRDFLKRASILLGGPLLASSGAFGAETGPVVETTYGKIRGLTLEEIKVFKGIPYGESTAGANRFMPPVKPKAWSGVRDVVAYGPNAPQTIDPSQRRPNALQESEDCLVLNVFTPSLSGKRPVMVWLHGGGFSSGTGSSPVTEGFGLARSSDVVVVTINHRLNVLGMTYLGEAAGSDFALSGAVGILDIVSALQWVKANIANFGGDPGCVTIFGQSGGGRKVTTVMSMPSARGLFHRAIIESGAVLRLTTREDAIRTTEVLLAELGLKPNQVREMQQLPVSRLLAANAAVQKKIKLREPGMSGNSPMVDGKALPIHPWDPTAPAISKNIPLMIGWTRTEETGFDRPTVEARALDEAGLVKRAAARLGVDPTSVIQAFRKAHPEASPWDLWVLIGTECARGTYTREVAKRKAAQRGAPVFVYRFDWGTPAAGGYLHSPHSVEIPFVFNNIRTAGQVVSKMPEAQELATKSSAAWAAFARTGNPNNNKLPKWPAYSIEARETMLFNNECRVENDPDRAQRLAIEPVLKLS